MSIFFKNYLKIVLILCLCPEPDEIKIENNAAYYAPDTNVKSTRVIRDDGVYIEHYIVITKFV